MKDDLKLSLLIDSLGENACSFAKKIDIHTSTIYHVLKGRNNISKNLASVIVSCFGQVNPKWLKDGTGEMFVTDIKNVAETDKEPVWLTMAAGDYESGQILLDDTCKKYMLPDIPGGFLLKVRDDSMLPEYEAGDVVCARFTDSASGILWGKNYVVLLESLGFIRKLKPSGSEEIIVMASPNPSYPEFTVKKESILKLARICGVIHYR